MGPLTLLYRPGQRFVIKHKFSTNLRSVVCKSMWFVGFSFSVTLTVINALQQQIHAARMGEPVL